MASSIQPSTPTSLSSSVSSNDGTALEEAPISSSYSSSTITILGFGSLLSKSSAQTTFPNLTKFRLGKVNNYRRVFAHPASIFFQRNIANRDTLEMSSLSAEFCSGASFICSVFEVSNEHGEFMETANSEVTSTALITTIEAGSGGSSSSGGGDDDDDDGSLIASMAFREREEEFDIIMVPYKELNDDYEEGNDVSEKKMGVLCCRSTDEQYIKQWGQSRFEDNYRRYGIDTIWNWEKDSGLRPCGPYLRHCVLASKNMGDICHNSFLDETFLVDRKTTIRSYLEKYPEVMDTLPPVELQSRYGG